MRVKLPSLTSGSERVPRRGEGVDSSLHRGGDAQRAEWVLHATRRSKRSCNCRKDGDYDVEDFSPGAVVVEGSHNGNLN